MRYLIFLALLWACVEPVEPIQPPTGFNYEITDETITIIQVDGRGTIMYYSDGNYPTSQDCFNCDNQYWDIHKIHGMCDGERSFPRTEKQWLRIISWDRNSYTVEEWEEGHKDEVYTINQLLNFK